VAPRSFAALLVRIEDCSGPGLEPEDKASQQTPRTRCASPDPDKQKTPEG
jgi:hypothetical protein